MANITKRANKRCADYLGGERAEVALLCEMKGMLGFGMVGAVVARRTTENALRKRTAGSLDEQGGIAASFPAHTAAVLVTPTRFLAMRSNGLRFHPPSMVLDRADVRAEVTGRKNLGKRVVFTFRDGTSAEVDVGPGQPLDHLVGLLLGRA